MNPTEHEIVVFFGILLGLLGAVLLVLQIVGYFRRQPPIEVQFATKEELAEIDRKFNALFQSLDAKLEKQFADMQTHEEARAGMLHKRINQILAGVAEIQGRCQAFHSATTKARPA